jgi:alpha-mannosidase
MSRRSPRLIVAALLLFTTLTTRAADTQPAATQPKPDTLWVIPHTHWEGAVFKTREEYLQIGLYHILHALRLLEKYPHYTFVLDQVAYVRPFLERYPEQSALFERFVKQGRLQLVLGMDVMPDDTKVGGESFIRQIQYGKRYYRERLGVDVKIAWMLDTFGHNPQLPQLLKLGGYSSFWFFRGVPRQSFSSEFIWEGIDGSKIPAFWEPFGYGDFFSAPRTLPEFETYARRRYNALNNNAKGHDRVVYSGADVSDPQDYVPPLMEQAAADGKLPFNLRFGTPTEFEAAVLKRIDLPVEKLDLNPIFQGTYSSRIELKQWMRESERLLTTAEKLAAISQFLGHPADMDEISRAWELASFNETHDLASGVMTDHVYDDTVRTFQIAQNLAEHSIDHSWSQLADAADTRGDGTAVLVFNPLSWPRTDTVELDWGFTTPGIQSVAVTDSEGNAVPNQIGVAGINSDKSMRHARVTFLAKDVPPMGYAVYHVKERTTAPPAVETPASSTLESDLYSLTFDPLTGAIKSIRVKQGDWEALSAPANVIARQDDHGDVWELYRGLDGGSRIAMTGKQPLPKIGTDKFSTDSTDKPAVVTRGPIYSEFTVSHPFDAGQFSTTVRLTAGSPRIDITTRLVNQSKFVRYQALFPTTLRPGHYTQSIPFGAIERPIGIEFPAMEWVDTSDDHHGISILNVALPGNLVTPDGTMLLSLLRSHTLGAYGFGGGYEPGMSSDGGLELGAPRTLHYALVPHNGDWRTAKTWREGAELANPLIARKATSHAGKLPAKWRLFTLNGDSAVVSSVQSAPDGALLIRLFEPTGTPAKDLTLTLSRTIQSAAEVNLMSDPLQAVTPQSRSLHIDLAPFEIKTVAVHLEKD